MQRTIRSLIVAVLITGGTAATAAPAYMLTDLGVLPGAYRGYATAVNDHGQAVGWSSSLTNTAHAYSGGVLSQLPPTTASYSFAWDINSNGVAVGEVGTSASSSRPVRWVNGVVSELSTPEGTQTGSAFAVNDAGVAVGYTAPGLNATTRATVFANSGFETIPRLPGAPGDGSSMAFDINTRGDILGWNSGQSYVYAGGAFSVLAGRDGYDPNVSSIADDGTVVGSLRGSSGGAPVEVGAVWSDGGVTTVSLGVWTQLRSVNDSGLAVGTYVTRALCPSCGFRGEDYHAMIWTEDDGAVDLNDLTVNLDGWILHNGFGVSSSGLIVGGMYSFEGGVTREHAFLLTPVPATVPEPSTLALLLVAGAVAMRSVPHRRLPPAAV